MSDARPPALRASDADRERTANTLREAAAIGRLTLDELDERLQATYAARTRSDLEPLVADVVAPGEEDAAPAPRAGRIPVRPGPGAAHWLIAIMGGCERRGRWRIGRRCTSINFMGGAELDLNDAEFEDAVTELTVISFMGGADVRVPDGLNVEVSEFAFMGGNGVRLGEAPPDRGGPLLRLRLISIMGGTDVKRGRRKSRAQKRAERRRRHLGHG